ncbi:hypothetical protein AUC70_08905 [Methyloceanibacter stevinii]|uniref:Uncharacterized protein n=1 Tax=Methyloceanibacter stevinii TaxID=1774970 RepID=A0A1E3VMG5_9HYPH|nr:hypothetical protein [Methyloceanibacter stevinii]ODR94713.1 hypothetical protein AUC70_08905 [Methyloceanibacter stevinii]
MKTLSYISLILFAAVSVVLAAARPSWVSDSNKFLEAFVGSDFLNILGVILAITLASIANIHLEFNKIEERYQAIGLDKSRDNLKKNAAWLIGLFCVGVLIVIVKPLVCGGEVAAAVANMSALGVLLWQILILISLNRLVFAIPPHIQQQGSGGVVATPPIKQQGSAASAASETSPGN